MSLPRAGGLCEGSTRITGVNLVPGQQDGSDDATQERTLEGVGSTTGEGFAATPHACPAGMVRILLLS
jgi:hypothetical protein